MIAFARFELPDAVAAEARRRVGGRALQVSEYATRLVASIAELIELVDQHGDPNSCWSLEQFDKVLELDGRIEALRIRLGIEALPAKDDTIGIRHLEWPDSSLVGEFKYVGFTHLRIWSGRRLEDDYRPDQWYYPTPDDRACASFCNDDWLVRMKSLKSISQELAVAPELDPEEEAIVGLIVSVGRRLTTTEVLDEFGRRGAIKAESTIKGKLAQLTKRKVLVNRADTNPKGYGLPEWS